MLKLAHAYRYCKRLVLIGIFFLFGGWGFFGHQRINRLAVFALPPEMIGFYKKNIGYITETAVNPDRRRFIVVDEAPRHYIDLDHYGDSALYTLPRYWKDAVEKLTEDTLKAYGILPWHINRMYYALKDAFLVRDRDRILKLSAEIGHYIGDAHVPLHTTENYNGQLTGQEGIHAFWESRLPELFSDQYDFFVGKASYIVNPQLAAWEAVEESHLAVDSVLEEERKLFSKSGDHKYSFETKGRQTQKVFSQEYSKAYHAALRGMVERRMRAAIKLTADMWYTAWVDAGQPDLNELIQYAPTEQEIIQRRKELEELNREPTVRTRTHEI
ncbi:MAG TPA: zinc dependent phospholipase C family protein [Ohtaekwangia sp.]|uniref:zinc dependent phospholipase C family protein n=1 Tax=Ohtaekwangia sp. TaxID=2066019 RepID=UPI002F935CCB